MIKPYVISLAQVKAYLGISDTAYDTQINLYIPDVTDDLTRKNGICNQDFLIEATADTAGAVTLSNVVMTASEWGSLYIGSQIYINGEDGEISAFDEDAQTITLASALTKTATEQDLYIRNFPQGARQTVAKMVFFKIDSTSTGTELAQDVKSRSIGPVSVSYNSSSADKVDRMGYPESLTKALKTIRKPRFF